MDSDATADSLSSPENGISGDEVPGFGISMLSSFSTQESERHITSRLSGARDSGRGGSSGVLPLDSFDLSPVTDATPLSAGVGDFLHDHHATSPRINPRAELTPFRETRGSIGAVNPDPLLRVETRDNPHGERGHDNGGTAGLGQTEARSTLNSRSSSVVATDLESAAPRSGRTRKRSRHIATTRTTYEGYTNDLAVSRQQQQQHRRLESSWPLNAAQERGREEGDDSLERSQPDGNNRPSISGRETTRQSSRPDNSTRHVQATLRSSASLPGRADHRNSPGGFDHHSVEHDIFESNSCRSDGVTYGRGRGGNGVGRGGSGGGSVKEDSSSRGECGGISGSSSSRWGGGYSTVGEKFSIVSDASSRGLPAPPVMPSGPLPAIATLKEHILTQRQQQHVDRERRWTADHMRKLNQVLAGHLAFAEVSLLHEAHHSTSEAISPAPSHGSAVELAPPVELADVARKSSTYERQRSMRAIVFGRLINRTCTHRERCSLFRAWSRIRLHTVSVAAREKFSAPCVAPDGAQGASQPRTRRQSNDIPTSSNAQNETADGIALQQLRRKQAKRVIVRTSRVRDRCLLFRGWSPLCLHTASLHSAEGLSASATAAARVVRAEVVEREVTAALEKPNAEKNAAEDGKGVTTTVAAVSEANRRADDAERTMREERSQRGKRVIARLCYDSDRRLLFRAWSRLCLHAASLNATESALATSAAVARAMRAEAMEEEAIAATAAAESASAVARLHARAEAAKKDAQQQREKRATRLIGRLVGDSDRLLLFRGWSRLCLHVGSLKAAEGTSALAAAAARAARTEAIELEAAEATATANIASAAASDAERLQLMEREVQKQREQQAKRIIARVCGDGDKRLLFRAWSRLCLHAASLNAAEAAWASATAIARAETTAAAAAAAAREDADKRERQAVAEMSARQKKRRLRMKNLIVRWSGEKDQRSKFRAWSRLCLYAASLNAAEAVSANAAGIARAARAEAMEREAVAAAEKAEALERAAGVAVAAAELRERTEEAERALEAQQRQHACRLVLRVHEYKETRLLFRGWSRLHLHAAFHKAAEAASAAATANARATRAKLTEQKAVIAVSSTDAAEQETAGEHTIREQSVVRRRAKHTIIRACGDSDKRCLFRAWSRLCLHAASLSASEGASAAATAAARAARAETVESNARMAEMLIAAAEKRTAGERSLREESDRRRAKQTIARLCGERDKCDLFRGWTRLCLHAASLGAASTIATTVARAATIKAKEEETTDTTKETKEGQAGATITVAPTTEDIREGTSDEERRRREQCGRVAWRLLVHVWGDRRQGLLFRGWSRLCFHAASLNAAEAASSAAAASARAVRAEVMQKEAREAAEKARAWQHVAARVAVGKDETSPDQGEVKIDAAAAREETGEVDCKLQEERRRRAWRLITHITGDREKRLLFRGWSRLCLHAASLNVPEEASAVEAATARADSVDALERQTMAAATAARISERTLKGKMVLKEHDAQRRRAKMIITRTCGERDKRGLFRGWSRLCLFAASLNAAEATSASTTAAAKTAKAEAMENEANSTVENAEAREKAIVAGAETTSAMAAKEETLQQATGELAAAAKLKERAQRSEQALRGQAERYALLLIDRGWKSRDKRLLFRGWSRLCLHAASLNAAEGASAAATAGARAARAEAMEKEATAANKTAEAWKKAAAASAAAAEAKTAGKEAHSETSRISTLAAGLRERAETSERALQEQKEYRAVLMITRLWGDKHRCVLFRAWSRLCVHAASLSAAEGASAAATAVARAARAEAMEKEATVAADQAEAWKRAAAASTAAAAAAAEKEASGASERAEVSPRGVREQQEHRAMLLITRAWGYKHRRMLFRAWSRLCLHAASRKASEGASAAAAAARAARVEDMENKAVAAGDQANAWTIAATVSAAAAAAGKTAREEILPEASETSTIMARLREKEKESARAAREQQQHRATLLITHVWRDKHRQQLFRGWSRLCLHAASLNAAEGDSAAATAVARATRVETIGNEADAAAARVKTATATTPSEKEMQEVSGVSTLAGALQERVKVAERAARQEQERRAILVITRVWEDKHRRLMFRGWSRLCLHASSLNAADGASTAATAVARVARAKGTEKATVTAADQADAWIKATTSSAMAVAATPSTEEALQEASGVTTLAEELRERTEKSERAVREHEVHRAMLLINRVWRDKRRHLLFRSWSRICLYATSLNGAKGASAAAIAVASAARAEEMEKEATTAAADSVAAAAASTPGEQALEEMPENSTLITELREKAEESQRAVRGQQEQRAMMLITHVWEYRQRGLLFRGWSRLCLHAASLVAAERVSAAANSTARVFTAKAMEKEAEAAARAAVATNAREEALKEARGDSILTTQLTERLKESDRAMQEQQKHQAALIVIHVWVDKRRRLLFRAWSRLCLHSASLNAAEASLATATAAARAARVDAMEREAAIADDAAARAMTGASTAREEALQEVSGASMVVAELRGRVNELEQTVREQQEWRAVLLITHMWGDKDRRLLFRGWSRLCLHSAAINAAEGVSAAATAAARAARASAMEKEATAAAEKAEAWQKAAAASAAAAAATTLREEALKRASGVSTLAEELSERNEASQREVRELQEHRAILLITRVWGDKNRRLLFRGWSRLCLYAASLDATEGASAAATAAVRAARAEAMEKEAAAAAEKAEARTKASAVSAAESVATIAREEALRETTELSTLATGLKETAKESDRALREHQERRARLLIARLCRDSDKRSLFRAWSRLCLHAAALNAADGASAAASAAARVARAESVEKEAVAAAASAEKEEGEELVRRQASVRRGMLRLCRDKDRQALGRGWRVLCRHTALSTAVAAGAAPADTSSPSADACDPKSGEIGDSIVPAAVGGIGPLHREKELQKLVHRHLRATRLRAIARGWAGVKASAAAAGSTMTLAGKADTAKKFAMMEAYAIDLQLQATKRGRELGRKTRALAILLKDDWATAVLARDRETRAARTKLAQAETDLEAQLDTMVGLAMAAGGRGMEGAGHSAGLVGDDNRQEMVVEVRENAQEDRQTREEGGGDPEVFIGETGAGVGNVSLQGGGARRLKNYVAGKCRDLNRARAEAQQWRARCEEMQCTFSQRVRTSAPGDGPRVASLFLGMLDKQDRRLASLYNDVAELAVGETGFPSSRRGEGGEQGKTQRRVRRRAAELLLQQMALAGDEARKHIRSLSLEIQRLLDTGGASAGGCTWLWQDAPGRPTGDAQVQVGDVVGKKKRTSPEGVRVLLEASRETLTAGTTFMRAVEEGVQSATDARELVSSLRSEVSALERHRLALQTKLDRLQEPKAGSGVDCAAAARAWIASAEREKQASALGTGNSQAATSFEERKARRARAERRAGAAAVVREAMVLRGGFRGESSSKAAGTGMGDDEEVHVPLDALAAAAELSREATRRAQEAFVAGRVIEASE